MASRVANHRNPSEVWVIVSRTGLAIDLWFGSKEKAEAYMSAAVLKPSQFRPVRLRQSDG